jgi:hypothetical protein
MPSLFIACPDLMHVSLHIWMPAARTWPWTMTLPNGQRQSASLPTPAPPESSAQAMEPSVAVGVMGPREVDAGGDSVVVVG